MIKERDINLKTFKVDTDRLYLKVFTDSDVTQKYVDALNDPTVMGLTESRYSKDPMTVKKAIEYAKWANQDNSIFFGIFEKSGNHIGNIRLHTISEHNRRAELGIMIFDKNQWGKGLATEALMGITNFAFTDLGLHKVEAEYYATNYPSQRLFEKAGYSIEGIIKDHFVVDGSYVNAVRIGKINPYE